MIVKKNTSCGCHVDHGCSDHGFTRPEFFAGQLLTEDDLDALTSYVVGKNALHNRHFFGDGVVCGLDVKVDVCKRRNVFVTPGHAIDCCGHDIIVPCEEVKIDVFKLLQELRTRLRGGYDCGDPCPQQSVASDKANDTRAYDLYVVYKEMNADYIAAYEGAGFSDGDCRPSRVRETFSFELRCPVKESKRPLTLNDRIRECLESKAPLADNASVANSLKTLNSAYLTLSAIELLKGIPDDQFQLRASQLYAQSQNSGNSSSGDVSLLRGLIAFALQLGFVDNRASAIDGNVKTGLLDKLDKMLSNVENNNYLGDEGKSLNKRYTELKKGDLKQIPDDFDSKSLIVGETVTWDSVQKAIGNLNAVRRQLLDLAEDGGYQLRTSLSDISELKPPVTLETIKIVHQNALEIANAALRHYAQCICEAFALPCETCNDTAVLIARLELDAKKCIVVDVCNMVKTFVLTHQRLRYLLPNIEETVERYRKMCCTSPSEQSRIQNAPSVPSEAAPESGPRVNFNTVMQGLASVFNDATGASLDEGVTLSDRSMIQSEVERSLRRQVSELSAKVEVLTRRAEDGTSIV